MKSIIYKNNGIILPGYIVAVFMILVLLYSCTKQAEINYKKKPSSYSSEVLDKWMAMQLRLMRNATGIPNQAFSRHFAYTGIAAMESLEPALHGQAEWTEKWNGLTGLPPADHSKNYYYPANVNAAMAAMNKAMFPNASAADKAAIDSLETVLKNEFLLNTAVSIVEFSSDYGKAVATAVFNWSETDGYKNANNPYTLPVGFGLWKPTPPAFASPATPWWGNNRNVVTGSLEQSQPGAPVTYSEQPGSPFYQLVNDVYNASLNLTNDQKAMAIFWRDVPGTTSPGHWLSILKQIVGQSGATLDKAALSYAVTGSAMNDALISCFRTKYTYNVVRPVTYIREVMGHTTWSSFIGTPAHPEYSSAHASLSAASAAALNEIFRNIGPFTDHTYDYLGLAPRTYASITDIGLEAGLSRFYAGIHYMPSIHAGSWQGEKVADNIFRKNLSSKLSR